MKFFVKDYTFIIATQAPDRVSHQTLIYSYASPSQIWQTYLGVQHNRTKGNAVFLFTTPHYDNTVREFLSYFQIIEAAGGLVRHHEKYLFINRFKKWDLPKGKIEEGEEVTTAATREIEEECNLKVQIIKPIIVTHHTYSQGDKHSFKNTYWFEAISLEANPTLIPQYEEGIEDVRWFDKQEVENVVLLNTYQSVKLVWQALQGLSMESIL